MSRDYDEREAGFTLIEVVISLSLFALISMAGLALVDSVIRVEEGTAGRLDRLGRMQRAMFLITRDFEQASGGTLRQTGTGVAFEGNAASVHQLPVPIRYALEGTSLHRHVGPAGAGQRLLEGIASARWTFFFPGSGWTDRLPDDPATGKVQPTAIALELVLDGSAAPAGSLRRVVELPTPPPPEPMIVLPQ
jgi:general secretion pathway protein J